jgi:phytoene desaturase
MTDRTAIIIGAGLAGLATGCYAQTNGYQTHIFEHHSQPGGVAAAWKRGSYLVDGGIHFIMGHKPGTGLHQLYSQLGVVPAVRFTDMTTYGRFVDEASGRSLLVTSDLDRLAADLGALSPPDAPLADALIASARGMQGLDMSEVGLSKPPELSGPLDQLKDLWSMRRFLRFFTGRFAQPVARYATASHDPVFRACLENLFTPDVPVFFISMILALLADGQLGFIDGSCLDFVRAIERRYLDLGGQVTYRATVAEVLVEGSRAVGVRLVDGSEHRASAVVSAADGRSTIFDMLGGQFANDEIRKRYATWPRFRPLIMISYGVTQEFPGEPSFVTLRLAQPVTVAGKPVDGLFLRLFNYSDRFAPPGKSVVQVEFETEWDYWNDLQATDRAAYDGAKNEVAAALLERLEAHYPGLSSRVEVTDVVTPYTFWRYTRNDRGAWEGWMMASQTMTKTIERTLPGLDRFYMAGQWVMPGGGVPPVLYSGRHAVQLLCRHDGKRFVTAP